MMARSFRKLSLVSCSCNSYPCR